MFVTLVSILQATHNNLIVYNFLKTFITLSQHIKLEPWEVENMQIPKRIYVNCNRINLNFRLSFNINVVSHSGMIFSLQQEFNLRWVVVDRR